MIRSSVDTALADGVAVVRMFLAERLGLSLQGEEAMDRIDDSVRQLIEVRGPVGTADLVTVLAGLVTALLSTAAGFDGEPEALFDSLIRVQVNEVRRLCDIDKDRSELERALPGCCSADDGPHHDEGYGLTARDTSMNRDSSAWSCDEVTHRLDHGASAK
ncbi:hypothetical protein [Streptomyces similanensis]|uniref:Uncharacterized protein n=1 Tax=Streptomyces similanensis TaxID=1274988 RepID=A0ABP9LAN7_9ACTN